MARGTLVKSKGRHPDSIRFSKSTNESPRASNLPVISNSVFSQAIKPSGHLISNPLRESSRSLRTSRITCVTYMDTKRPTHTQNQELLNGDLNKFKSFPWIEFPHLSNRKPLGFIEYSDVFRITVVENLKIELLRQFPFFFHFL